MGPNAFVHKHLLQIFNLIIGQFMKSFNKDTCGLAVFASITWHARVFLLLLFYQLEGSQDCSLRE